jgi:tRNA (guanine-N1)-methyltransferase
VIRFDVVTLFPEMFVAVTGSGITSRALETGLWSLTTWNPRDFTEDNYRTVDERPYGGGPGMVMLAEPLERALDAVTKSGGNARTIYLSPQGRKLDHRRVLELAREPAVTLLCGRREVVVTAAAGLCASLRGARRPPPRAVAKSPPPPLCRRSPSPSIAARHSGGETPSA